ncbi:MAG: tRNA pseudouridine(55) synthase TruB [Hyphomicrobiales bacterium]|nr:tRNA pseudouridine(55) synthase TruB [Hyphomicrobiales bacterium]
MRRSNAAFSRASNTGVRQLRVGETMRRILAELLSRGDLPHPDLRRLHISITEVHVSPDLRNASVFLMPLEGKETDAALGALEKTKGLLRRQLSMQMVLKRYPDLSFSIDPSFDAAREVDRLLNLPQVARDLQSKEEAARTPPSGWLILDKPRGITSARAVARVKAMTGAGKAGHAGTLDPNAEGILPVALGEATKLVSLLSDASKSYRFELVWGEATATDDSEGEVVAQSPVRPKPEDIRAALNDFLGEKEQMPPRYSALHVGGVRAYALARAGKPVDLEPRRVSLHAASFLEADSTADTARFEIDCSKGFYVRALARDLGERLGTCAHVRWLRRTRVGMFGEESAVPLEISLENGGNSRNNARERLQPLESVLADTTVISVTPDEEARLRQGQPILLTSTDERCGVVCNSPGEPLVAMRENFAVALLRRGVVEGKEELLSPSRVIARAHAG